MHLNQIYVIVIFEFLKNIRLQSLKEVSSRHGTDLDRAVDDMILSKLEIDKFEGCIPEMANSHRYYQDLRGYVTDLVECYDEKVGAQKLCITENAKEMIYQKYYVWMIHLSNYNFEWRFSIGNLYYFIKALHKKL